MTKALKDMVIVNKQRNKSNTDIYGFGQIIDIFKK